MFVGERVLAAPCGMYI